MNSVKRTKIALTGFENGHCNAIFMGMLKNRMLKLQRFLLHPAARMCIMVASQKKCLKA